VHEQVCVLITHGCAEDSLLALSGSGVISLSGIEAVAVDAYWHEFSQYEQLS